VIEAAGFVGVRFSVRRWDAFGGSPSESSAARFGTEGVAIFAVKPRRPASPSSQGSRRARGAGRHARRRGHEVTTAETGEVRMPREPSVEADAVLDAAGQACATLTPLIKQRIRALASGQVLEVRTDDPAAREGVPAWSRLTGNPLVATVEEDAQRTKFFIRKR
jgi:tRNA 2-thiouridine synthesizing protein A